MKRIIFIETPNKLSVNEMMVVSGGADSCTDYSGTCLNFDVCKDKFTGSCSAHNPTTTITTTKG